MNQKLKDYIPTDDDVLALNASELTDETGADLQRQLIQLISTPKGNAFQQIQAWRKLGQKLYKFMLSQNKIIQLQQKESDRIYNSSVEKNNKHWTDEEENALIELVCDPSMTMVKLSTIFGRTPNAISAKISRLVGVKKIDKNIAGRFIGTLNGKEVNGYISGILNS